MRNHFSLQLTVRLAAIIALCQTNTRTEPWPRRSLSCLLGQLEVELMATSKSHQVEVYFSTLEDNEAGALEAFTKNWSKLKMVNNDKGSRPNSKAGKLWTRS